MKDEEFVRSIQNRQIQHITLMLELLTANKVIEGHVKFMFDLWVSSSNLGGMIQQLREKIGDRAVEMIKESILDERDQLMRAFEDHTARQQATGEHLNRARKNLEEDFDEHVLETIEGGGSEFDALRKMMATYIQRLKDSKERRST